MADLRTRPGTARGAAISVLGPAPAAPAAPAEPLWRELLGRQVRRRRREREETLADTAAAAGISPQYLSEIERGLKEPSSEMIAAVAGALDTTLLDLTAAVVRDLASVPALHAPATAGLTGRLVRTSAPGGVVALAA